MQAISCFSVCWKAECQVGTGEGWGEWRRQGALTKWIAPSNQGKTLTFAFPLNRSRRRKRSPLKGNLSDVWMSECVKRLPKHIYVFTALDRVWLFCLDPAGKLKLTFVVTFSLRVGCLAVGPLLQSGLDKQRRENGLLIMPSSSSWPGCLHTSLVRPNKSPEIICWSIFALIAWHKT